MAVELIAALLLVAANGFFVGSEFAIARTRPTQVDDWLAAGRPGARSVRHAVGHIDAYLAACQLGITLASLGLGVVGERAFHRLFDDALGAGSVVLGIGIAGALAFGVITLLHVVVGELAPKSAAIARTGPIVLALAPPMRVFYLVTRPIVDLFNAMGNLLLKPFGVPAARDVGHSPLSEDELRTLLRQSAAEGLIDLEEGRFGENALLFGDRRAREVMVPRPEVDYVTVDDSVSDVAARAIDSGRTRLPLCQAEGGLDAAVGVVHAKDLLPALMEPGERDIRDLGRPLGRVSESVLIDALLRDLRRAHTHIALVVDEHGTAIGIVTLEDILEEIVGEIEDEFDVDHEEMIQRRDGRQVVSGAAPVRLVVERLGVGIEDPHEATIGGHVMELLGRLPDVGERVEVDGHVMEVTAVHDARVSELALVGAIEDRDGPGADGAPGDAADA